MQNENTPMEGQNSTKLEMRKENLGAQHVVVELIEQQPSVSLHPTEKAALDHAVQCAMENLHSPDHDEEDSRLCFEDTLDQYGHIREGDYEVYILTPTN